LPRLLELNPVLFRAIPGLHPLKQTLVYAVEANHVAHAQLFHGPAGSGNLALALAFATYLVCEDRQPEDACGRCAACVKMGKLAHPDVHHIFPVASTKKVKETSSDAYLPLWREFVAAEPFGTLADWLQFIGVEGNRQGNISAEEARNVIRKVTLKAYEAEYKILIIWQPEQLNGTSANALLKILEEPPEKTVFLLVATAADRLLPTILSRTQRVSVPAFEADDVRGYVQQHAGVDEARARQVAYLAEGNLAQALELAEGEPNDQHEWFANWMRTAYKADLGTLVKLADEFDTKGKETQKSIFEYGLNLFRDLFLFQNGAEELVRLEGSELTFVQNFAKAVRPERLESIVDELTRAHYHVERNVRAKFVFLDLSLNVVRLLRKN
jgi:DNA polymerase-3 subunit delta'